MKKIAFALLALGYGIIFTGPEHCSDARIIIALISFGVAFTLGLQVTRTDLGKK